MATSEDIKSPETQSRLSARAGRNFKDVVATVGGVLGIVSALFLAAQYIREASISKDEFEELRNRVSKLENLKPFGQIGWMDVRVQTPGGPSHATPLDHTLVINVAAKDTEITLPVPEGRKLSAAWVTPITEITDGSATIFKIEAVIRGEALKLVGHANAMPGTNTPVGGSIVYRVYYTYTDR